MSIVVNTNTTSLIVQKNLNIATNILNSSMERMSTGSKINKAADDAAGFFVETNMDTQIRGSQQAQSNIQIGMNMLSKAEGDINTLLSCVQRIRDLSIQASNEVYNEESLNAIDNEINLRINTIRELIDASEFNGQKLFKSFSQSTRTFAIGPNAEANENSITIKNVFNDMIVGPNSLEVLFYTHHYTKGTVEYYYESISRTDTSIKFLAEKLATIGAYQNRLESANESLTVSIENLSAAKSTIMDADIAKESSNYVKSQILQQASASLLTQVNQAPSIALNLIR